MLHNFNLLQTERKRERRGKKSAIFVHLSHFHHLTIQRQDSYLKVTFAQYTKVYTLDHSETHGSNLWCQK